MSRSRSLGWRNKGGGSSGWLFSHCGHALQGDVGVLCVLVAATF